MTFVTLCHPCVPISKFIHRKIVSTETSQLQGNLKTENNEIKKEFEELRVRDEERMEEMKVRDEERMLEMKVRDEERMLEMKEMIRKLSEGSGKQEMAPMYMLQVGIIVFGCMVVGLALFQHNKR